MTTSSMSQGYASAVGSLDWLDVSYSPLQLTEKFRLPTLVRIGEGHYGNADDTCFSAMQVVKLHGVQRVDMVLAQSLNDKDDPSSASPIRICLPKGLPGLFNVHQTEDGTDKATKLYRSVRQLSDEAPQCVIVLRKPSRKDCGVVKGDILKTIGITMCNGLWEEQGLRCIKQGESGEEVFLNLKWKGQYKTIPDPEGDTLANIVSQNKLPCMVSFRSPGDQMSQLSSTISTLLPHLERPLVLEREITTEFLVGTTIGAGPRSSSSDNLGNNGTSGSSRTQEEHQQPAIVVLSKNANVCFQICQDMVHRRTTYTSLLGMFGECSLDKIPLELFIGEYAAPFVAFMRTDSHLEAPQMAAPRSSERSQRGLSRSTPDLPSTLMGIDGMFHEGTEDGVIHNYADPGKAGMSRRALPPLPTETQPHANTLPSSSLTVKDGNDHDHRTIHRLEGIRTSIAAPINRSSSLQLISTDYPSRAFHPQSHHRNPVSVPHTEPPPGFTSDLIETERHQHQVQCSSESPERLPSRRAPPPPPRTTPRIVAEDALYSNLDSSPPPPILPAPQVPAPPLPAPPSNIDVTPPSKPNGGSPPEVVPRRRGLKGSQSLNTCQRPSTDRLVAHSVFHTIPLKRDKESHTISVRGECESILASNETHTEYLKPRKPRAEASTRHAALPRTASSRSHHSTGLLLDNIDLVYVEPSKEQSASESNLQIIGLPAATSIRTVKDIPLDIGNLTCSQLMRCLCLLNLDDQVVERVRRSQINGSLLAQLSSATVKEELALSDFEAEKFDAFRQGWRPDDGEAS